jgi:hypothetical protein
MQHNKQNQHIALMAAIAATGKREEVDKALIVLVEISTLAQDILANEEIFGSFSTPKD